MILGQVERAMLEQQRIQLRIPSATEDHGDSDQDTSGDCRDIDLEQAGRSRSFDEYQQPAPAAVPASQPSKFPGTEDENRDEEGGSGFVDVNRNHGEILPETDDAQSREEGTGAATHDYDVPRSTPVGTARSNDDDSKCGGIRRPREPPPPPPTGATDCTADSPSSTPLDGTPHSQASCSTLVQQQDPPSQDGVTSATDDNLTCSSGWMT